MIEPAQNIELLPEDDGYFSGEASAGLGTLYRYRLDGADQLVPDPASRFQPQGPHGPSQLVDPRAFQWTDQAWRGVELAGQVIYEMHIGTFTPEGTWKAASRELSELAAVGVTVVEVMPVADFSGRFGWGYDGVDLYAPTRLYGSPDDFRRFVDVAHANGLGVMLDVVYNHFGPDGNYLRQFSEDYFTDRYTTDWGEAINYDGPNARSVREFFISNAAYWIDEFHLDGLRFDATQNIYDSSTPHILAEIAHGAREAARGRRTILVAENEPQLVKIVRPETEGGYGLDALWNDDYHHSALVALTGRREAYYADYLGRPQELISTMKYGYLYQGQYYGWQQQRRGSPAFGVRPAHFIVYLENHDQVANSARGEHCHSMSAPGCCRALTALTLLAPATPMLFQGQEFNASSPFLFFADHEPDLAALVREGRREFLAQFRAIATPEIQASLPDPADAATFERCKLKLSERQLHADAYALHRDLLQLRRDDAVFRMQAAHGLDGAVLGDAGFVLRWFAPDRRDRLLIVNLGPDMHFDPAPEPLLAPPEAMRWQTLWSSEDVRYGGRGSAPLDTEQSWRIPGQAAVVLSPIATNESQTPALRDK